MNEINPSTPSVVTQPESMHGPTHSHGSLHLIVGMLGVFLVLESIVLGYVVTQYVVEDQDEVVIEGDEVTDEDDVVAANDLDVPFLYTPLLADGQLDSRLIMVDRETGVETTVYENMDRQFVQLIAVPQVGYDGKVIIALTGRGDDPGLHLYQLDMLNNNELMALDLNFILTHAFAVSPDQTKIAFVPFGRSIDAHDTGDKLVVFDFVTQETSTIGDAGDYAFWSTIRDFDGAGAGYDFDWLDTTCLEASLYSIAAEEVDVNHAYPLQGRRTYCLQM